MTPSNRLHGCILPFLLWSLSQTAQAELILNPPTGNNYVTNAPCLHGTLGDTNAIGLAWTDASKVDAPDSYVKKLAEYLNKAFPTFSFKVSLLTGSDGAVTINSYKAFDTPACVHGVAIDATTNLANSNGESIAWIQTSSRTGDCGNDTSYRKYVTNKSFSETLSKTVADNTPHSGSETCISYLVYWTPSAPSSNEYSVKILGDLKWGYNFSCTVAPEPTSVVTIGIGIFGLSVYARRMRR